MQDWFVTRHACSGWRRKAVQDSWGQEATTLYVQNKNNEHPSCHYAQTLWMLKNATFGKKKKYASLLFKKKCKNAISFFSCKILQFIVIYKCKLWYQLTFLQRDALVNEKKKHRKKKTKKKKRGQMLDSFLVNCQHQLTHACMLHIISF